MNTVTRRTFLRTSAVLAAASAARHVRATANDRIRVGVIGCRNRGPQVAESMLRSGQFDVTTLCDCDEAMSDQALKDNGKLFPAPPKTVRDFRRVLDDKDVDAVVVATPDHWHALMTVMALDAGKHVYVEKPASYNVADGKAMVAAQTKHPGLVVQIGTQQRSGSHFQEARQFLRDGGLGKVGFVRACIIHDRGVLPIVPDSAPPATLDYDLWTGPAPMRPYNDSRVHYNWHFMLDYGTGEMGNWGAHWLDIARWFVDVDFPKSVSGLGGQFVVKDAKEWPDTQTALLEYPDLTMLWEQRLWSKFGIGGGPGCHAEFNGDKGSMVISRGGWTFYPKGEKDKNEDHPKSELEVAHAKNFVDCIRGQAQPAASMQEGHVTAVLCHLCNISAMLNRRVVFDGETQSITGDAEAAKWMSREYRAPWRLEV